MPRTLYEINPSAAFSIDDDASALGARPELAVLVARIIATWSLVEGFIGLAATALLAGRADVAMSIFESLPSSAQTTALYAAAKSALPREDAELFCAALKVTNSLGKGRNSLAHGIIASADGIGDAILLVEQRNFVELTKLFFHYPDNWRDRPEQVAREIKKFSRKVLVVGKSELEEMLQEIERANKLATYLSVLAAPNHHDKETARSELQADPAVAQQLRKI
jgi:hypothetical protein